VYSHDFVWPINIASQFVAFATVATLVSELRLRLTRERELSRVDVLTGLPSRRAFYERAQVLLSAAARSSRPVTLSYLDLDNFKQVNDQRGHAEGDRALCAVAELLRAHFRASDAIGRLGGDEFAILLFDADGDGATTTLERMRSRIATVMGEQGWPISASIGAVAFQHPPKTLEQALAAADELMYRAKQGGKNRVHVERISGEPLASLAPA
jgi:diguanylate cyclase (GGDEF)-like protein